MAPHSSTLARKIPWTKEPGRLQSVRSRRVGHDRVTSLSLFTFMHWSRKWQPTPVFLPGFSSVERPEYTYIKLSSQLTCEDSGLSVHFALFLPVLWYCFFHLMYSFSIYSSSIHQNGSLEKKIFLYLSMNLNQNVSCSREIYI